RGAPALHNLVGRAAIGIEFPMPRRPKIWRVQDRLFEEAHRTAANANLYASTIIGDTTPTQPAVAGSPRDGSSGVSELQISAGRDHDASPGQDFVNLEWTGSMQVAMR